MTDDGRDDEETEGKCLRCGRCCHLKFRMNGKVKAVEETCLFFNPITKLCTIYSYRRGTKICRTLEEGLNEGLFPADCPHAMERKGYVCRVDEWWYEKGANP